MKFIHTADIHLGATPDAAMPWSAERAGEIRDSFYRLLDLADKEETELFLIAGDLFHRQPLKRELKELNYRFSQMPQTRFVIIAGNHDYIGPQSYYRDFQWADNVTFFRKNHIAYVYLEELNVIIYGMSYDRNQIRENMYDQLRPMHRFKDGSPVPSDCLHILMAHGGDADHIPINIDRLRQAGFDYVALGHIHKAWIDDKAAIAYPGSLEPLDRTEEGVHGYIEGYLDKEEAEINFVPFACRSYQTLLMQLVPGMTMRELAQAIGTAMSEQGKQHIYQIVLDGFRDVDFELDEQMIRRFGKVVSISDRSLPDFDFLKLYEENKNNIIGLYIKQITEMDISDSMKAKALCYGMKALLKV